MFAVKCKHFYFYIFNNVIKLSLLGENMSNTEQIAIREIEKANTTSVHPDEKLAQKINDYITWNSPSNISINDILRSIVNNHKFGLISEYSGITVYAWPALFSIVIERLSNDYKVINNKVVHNKVGLKINISEYGTNIIRNGDLSSLYKYDENRLNDVCGKFEKTYKKLKYIEFDTKIKKR